MGVETESTEDSPAAFATLAGHIRDITPTLTLQENTAKAKLGSNEVTQQIGNLLGAKTSLARRINCLPKQERAHILHLIIR